MPDYCRTKQLMAMPFNPLLYKRKINKKTTGHHPKKRKKSSNRQKIDWKAKAQEYQKMIQTGQVKNQAELARKEGVSRAWITKIMKHLEN